MEVGKGQREVEPSGAASDTSSDVDGEAGSVCSTVWMWARREDRVRTQYGQECQGVGDGFRRSYAVEAAAGWRSVGF